MQSPALIKIVKQPWSQVIPLEGRFRLLCEAVSSRDEPLFYQWHFHGTAIPGATKQTYIRQVLCYYINNLYFHCTSFPIYCNWFCITREKIDRSAYGSYWCVVSSSSNTKPDVSKTARIEQSHGTPSPALSSRSGNFERIEGKIHQCGWLYLYGVISYLNF